MKAKVYLNQPLTQDRYGLHFEKGEALCDNEYIIKKLQAKGVKVEIIKEEKTIDEMTVAELKEYAVGNNIEISSNVRSKNDIIEFIKNHKEEDEEVENTQVNNEDSETNLNDTESEENNEESNEERQKAE